MTSKRKQLEKTLAETKDNIVRMQLTRMLNDELQRQNGIIRKVADAIDSLLREMIGLLGKRSPKNKSKSRDSKKIGKVIEKQMAQKSTKKQSAKKSPKKGEVDIQQPPDDLAELIAIWPKLPEYVKAAITDIVRIS